MRTALEHQDGVQQALGVRMPRRRKDVVDRSMLHHVPLIHHGNLVGDLGDHAHVMGDEHQRHAVEALQVLHEVEDLGLGGDIERRRRLVGDQELWLADEGHGGHGALTHAATELEGIAVDSLRRSRDLDAIEHLDGICAGFGLAHPAVQPDGFDNLRSDGVNGAQACHRFLEDHRDLAAPDAADPAAPGIERREVDRLAARPFDGAAVEEHLAADDAARLRHDVEDGAGGDALAAAALADHAERPAPPQGHADMVDRLDGLVARFEPGAEILHLEHDAAVGFGHGQAYCR